MSGSVAADGHVTDEGTNKFLPQDMNELHGCIVRGLTVLPRPT